MAAPRKKKASAESTPAESTAQVSYAKAKPVEGPIPVEVLLAQQPEAAAEIEKQQQAKLEHAIAESTSLEEMVGAFRKGPKRRDRFNHSVQFWVRERGLDEICLLLNAHEILAATEAESKVDISDSLAYRKVLDAQIKRLARFAANFLYLPTEAMDEGLVVMREPTEAEMLSCWGNAADLKAFIKDLTGAEADNQGNS